jgi:hypothetical protein
VISKPSAPAPRTVHDDLADAIALLDRQAAVVDAQRLELARLRADLKEWQGVVLRVLQQAPDDALVPTPAPTSTVICRECHQPFVRAPYFKTLCPDCRCLSSMPALVKAHAKLQKEIPNAATTQPPAHPVSLEHPDVRAVVD